MLADIDASQFSIIGNKEFDEEKLLEDVSSYCKEELPHVGIIHGDPSNPATPNIIEKMSETVPSAYLVGGLTSSNSENYQVANDIIQGSVSGIFFCSRSSYRNWPHPRLHTTRSAACHHSSRT